uniref:Protein kinase domain-containing protein n=1 Tax=Helianthus annuus TaxID=4232 RepID=A0A251RSH9_HELAN
MSPLSPILLLLLLLPLFFITMLAQSNNSTYPYCPSINCGNVTVSYPFWTINNESLSQFCGYDGFGINCSYNGNQRIPQISFGGDSYYVQSINYELGTIFLADYDVSPVVVIPNNCPRVRHNINLGTLPLDFTTSSVNLNSEKNVKKKVIISLCSAVFGILLMCVVFYIWRRRQNKRRSYGSSYRSRNISSFTSSMTDPEKNGAYHGVQIFKYRELEKATNYFDSRNELGDGGFGTVYEGKLKDGRVVAVKRLYENNYKRVEQFMNEVGILAHLRHRNLVSLYGCTTHHSRELLLVYEYISNGTVADHLHGEKSSPGSLKWTTRMSIAVETASALVYLHASDVVHRDVKTNNILLDNSFTVKVADFGLSRLFPNNVTHVSTAPQGTPGYVDPEYHECYQLTNKSDVYSFGVVLVELISSKPAVDITRHRHEINLSSMALSKIQNDALHELVDPHLGYDTDNEIRKMISAVAELAFQCLQNDRDSRPSMDEVLECLVAVQNGMSSNKHNMLDGTSDDAVLLNHSQDMSPDSVAAAWSTSTLSTSSG